MKTLRIYNYEILNFDAQPTVFSSKGFTRIDDPKLVNTLHHMIERQSTEITQHELTTILESESLQPQKAISFLKAISIIGEPRQPPHFKNVTVCIDWEIPDTLKEHIEQRPNNKIKIIKTPQLNTNKHPNPTLFVLACSKLKPDELRTNYTNLLKNNPDCGISVGFISNHFFHLTETHIPSIGNPCAFCTLDRIAHYESVRASQHHWSRIWSFCQSNNIDLPKTTLDEWQSTIILGTIASFTNKLTHFQKSKVTQDQILRSRTLNLTDGSFTEDCSIHWSLCQCSGEML